MCDCVFVMAYVRECEFLFGVCVSVNLCVCELCVCVCVSVSLYV